MTLISTKHNEILSQVALGDYGRAAETLGECWIGAGTLPERNGHNDHEYAVLVMLCGILTVEQGLTGGRLQEQGKDMLSLSVRLFGDDVSGGQMARAWLAIAYVRCGDFNESLLLCDDLLASKDSDLEITVCAAKTKAIALDGLGYPEKALEALDEIAVTVEAVTPLDQGKVHLQRGKLLRKLGQFDEALESYDLAIRNFREAKSLRYEASAANNMGAVYMYRGRFSQAHIFSQTAIRLFHEIGDQVHEGAALDMSAQISQKQGKFRDAERSAQKAIALLEQTDRSDYLAEAYTTLGSVLVEIEVGAAEPFEKAANIYRETGNTVLLDSVNGQLWESVLRLKQIAESHRAKVYESLRPIERLVIERVLDKHNWRVSPTAKELKLTPRGLSEKLKKHFPDLYAKCPVVVPRRKSIITK